MIVAAERKSRHVGFQIAVSGAVKGLLN
jgi:hypothetical protein